MKANASIRVLQLGLLAGFITVATAQEKLFCLVCEKGPLSGQVWKHPKGYVCDVCYKIETRCDHCGLPIVKDFLKTKDGRFFCALDKGDLVLNQVEAEKIFAQTVYAMGSLSQNQMALRGSKPNVTLFDVDYWNHQSGKTLDTSMRRGGFSQTRMSGNRFTHNVLLLSGLPREELVSVCAHEYTHLWINENKQEGRDIELHTIEAICELVAYKVAGRAGYTNQLDRIKKNPYTNGRILDLLEADRQYGFSRVLNWVKTGTNEVISVTRQRQIAGPVTTASSRVAPMRSAPGSSQRSPPVPVGSRALKLQSIARTAGGFQATVNGVRMNEGNIRRLNVEGRPSNVYCLKVTENSVTVTVNRDKPKTLYLNQR